jgi:hypothetical protein
MDKMHAKRLLKLAALLDTVPRKEFDLNRWKLERSCGTVACACGWAATIPAFRRAGLSLKLNSEASDEDRKEYDLEHTPATPREKELCGAIFKSWCATDGWSPLIPQTYRTMDAAGVFFGLTENEVPHLFLGGEGYSTPKQVAREIRKVVKQYHPELLTAAA